MQHFRSQNGVALVLVLILLGTGGLIIGPALRQTSTALNFFGISRENAEVAYALDAVTQQALWLLESTDPFQDCDEPLDSVVDTFADCVALRGSWDLATADRLESKFNESEIDAVNGQQVIVTVQVPGALGAPPDPTPTPISSACFNAWVSRSPTWVQVGEPIDYTVTVYSCSSGSANRNVRHVAVIFSPAMSFVPPPSPGGTGPATSPPGLMDPATEPEEGDCTALDTNTTTAACVAYPADSRLESWPSEDTPWSGGSAIQLRGGEEGTITFQLTPNSWGIFYVDVTVCFFNVGNPCAVGSHEKTGKVAPVVAGMFNIQGKGKGNAFGASSKLDDSGADLISEQPE